jgi:hypothetical protein
VSGALSNMASSDFPPCPDDFIESLDTGSVFMILHDPLRGFALHPIGGFDRFGGVPTYVPSLAQAAWFPHKLRRRGLTRRGLHVRRR